MHDLAKNYFIRNQVFTFLTTVINWLNCRRQFRNVPAVVLLLIVRQIKRKFVEHHADFKRNQE